jgi:hypothetical protein
VQSKQNSRTEVTPTQNRAKLLFAHKPNNKAMAEESKGDSGDETGK